MGKVEQLQKKIAELRGDVAPEEDDAPEVVLLDEHGNEIEEAVPEARVVPWGSSYPHNDDAKSLLTRDEIKRGGGERVDDEKSVWWMGVNRLCEWERMDRAIKSDKVFFEWFHNFTRVNGMVASRTTDNSRSNKTWNDYWKPVVSTGKKYLSDQWYGSSWFSGATDENRKLAVALQAVQTTVRVVHNGAKRMRVVFSAGERTDELRSFTAYDEQLIAITPKAILDKKLDDGEAIDITTGFALHEGSHAEFSQDTLTAIQKPDVIRPLAVAGLLHNLFEDIKIERKTSDNFPGFAGYFDKSNGYMWPFTKPPKTWGPTLDDKLNGIIVGVKWRNEFKPAEDADPALAAEMPWWREQTERYIRGDVPPRQAIEEGIERLKLDPATKKEMEELTQQEKEQEKLLRDFAEKLKAAMARLKGKVTELCPSPGQPMGQPSAGKGNALPLKQASEVAELAAEGMSVENTERLHIPDLGAGSPDIVSLRPQESEWSRQAWNDKGKPKPEMVARMRNAFFFRPVAQQWTTRLQRSGSLDEDELWRATREVRDYRVFEQRNVESSPDTNITLLVDISGSMAGSKVTTAMQAAAVMHEVLKTQPGVRVRVRAHTGDCHPGKSGEAIIHKIWERGEPLSRLGLIQSLRHGNNYDGFAIGWCVKELVEMAKPDEQRVLIVLADGQPAGYGKGLAGGYGGAQARKHVWDTQEWARQKGVDVIQIAIDHSLDPTQQKAMFRHWIPFEGLERLPSQITNILKRLIK